MSARIATLASLVALGGGLYEDPATGEIGTIDEPDTANDPVFAGYWDDDYDDGPEFGYDDDDDDDYDDDDDDYDDDGDFGAREDRVARRRSRRARRRSEGGPVRRAVRNVREGRRVRAQEQPWVATLLNDSTDSTGAGSFEAIIRPQHDFKAKDISFEGSTPGLLINSIFFGDRPIWRGTGAGVPITYFSNTSFIRGLLKGQEIRQGLDIVVTFQATTSGQTLSTQITGLKPGDASCRI